MLENSATNADDPASHAPTPNRRLMKLEALRGAAAAYVVCHHFVHDNPEFVGFKPVFRFGQSAVMIFFVLSGFVIYYASIHRDPNICFRDYFMRRFRRIYPAFVLVLFLTYAIMCLAEQKLLDFRIGEFIGNVLQLQDRNHSCLWIEPYWMNSPLWSLSYEWWFYMFFFVVHATTKHRIGLQKPIVTAMAFVGFGSFILYPNQLSLFVGYFILWWSGVELAREWTTKGRVTFRGQLWSISMTGILTICWLIPAVIAKQQGEPLVLAKSPYIEPRHFLTVFLAIIIGITWYKLRWIGFDQTLGWFARLAPISYVLYIIHYPIVYLAGHLRPLGNGWLDILWAVPLILAISWVIEQPLQKKINGLLR